MGKYLYDVLCFIPEGAAIFFPSYHLMEHYISTWSRQKILSKIIKIKKLFVEKKNRAENEVEIQGYTRYHKEGAIIMAVMGGKFSEGFDFKDGLARAIFAFGIPYPSTRSPQVLAKKSFIKNFCPGI